MLEVEPALVVQSWLPSANRFRLRRRSRLGITSQEVGRERSITDYESNYANVYRFLRTKPQGYHLIHAATEGKQKLLQTSPAQSENFTNLTRFMPVVYPLLAVLALPLLASLARHVVQEGQELRSAVIYLDFPRVLLFTLQLDQFLFLLVFLDAVLLADRTLKKVMDLAFGLGAHMYLASCSRSPFCRGWP